MADADPRATAAVRSAWLTPASPLAQRLTVSEDRFGRVILAFMALGFISLTVAGLNALWVVQRAATHQAWVNHTYLVQLHISQAERVLERMETTRRGYLLAPGPVTRTELDGIYRRDSAALAANLDHLGTMTADNPRQQANLRTLRPLLAVQLGRQRATMRLAAGAGTDARAAAQARFAGELDSRQMLAIRARFAAMFGEESGLLVLRNASQRASARAFYAVLSVAGLLLALVAAISFFVIRRFTRDLTASRDSLGVLNDTLEEQVATRTADLSRANEEIQRFAYIVSHDLRSPLVNVMGFTAELEEAARSLAELVDRAEADAPRLLTADARDAARVDLPEAIGFIRTATGKMDRLINAILRLSREGRRVITPERLDMEALVAGIRDTMSHQLDSDGTVLAIEAPLPPVTSDRLAVEQILSNLVENAAKYLQPDRPGRITVSGEATASRVTYAVADNGRGIAPADHARVFDLFRRSGAQDKPGEGIGLAHVRALAYRLGGTVDMTSELGQGTTFRLHLPIEPGA